VEEQLILSSVNITVMPVLILYFLKLSISLSVVWIFYQLLLRRLTFYSMNRWYLLLYSLLCFFIPLINVSKVVEEPSGREPLIVQYIPSMVQYAAPPVVTATHASPAAGWDIWSVVLVAMALGGLFLLARLVRRWISLIRVRKEAGLGEYRGIKVYRMNKSIAPFSFGRAVYINEGLYPEKELEEIILHEYVHVRQRHTVDILLAELLTMVNWYNPFVWLIRYSIRQNLEFIADREVIRAGADRKSYQYHLLKMSGPMEYKLANSFNFSSLKKRIVMMNKLKSARLNLARFALILPLLAVLLAAFRSNYRHVFPAAAGGGGAVFINESGIVVDYDGYAPLEGVRVVDKVSGQTATTDARGYYHLSIPVKSDTTKVYTSFYKAGYTDTWFENDYPAVKETTGMFGIGILIKKNAKGPMFVPPYMGAQPGREPDYEDALGALKWMTQQMDGLKAYVDVVKTHQEVALFYTTEDKGKEIVILKNGLVERYGYPGGKTLEDLTAKYGSMRDPGPRETPVTSAYLSNWQRISAEAEKSFHTTNSSVRHIIFPGDSRIIAVPAEGKPVVYDMDNDDPKERTAFEDLYGKLPDCVPAAGLHTHTGNR